MIRRYRFSSILLGVFFLFSFPVFIATASSVVRAVSQSRYSRAHSLGDSYIFDPRDGWMSVNATNSRYKYSRNPRPDAIDTPSSSPVERRNEKNGKHDGLSEITKSLFKGITAIGQSLAVTITWYTGNDLKNPSCWENGDWTPTDQSFVCALTLIGWKNRPKCFGFIELCNNVRKCVYVRVVDTCAGCKPGSHHVDLTEGPFEELATDLDVGVLTVNLREATEPKQWSEDLWGPQVNGHKGKH